MSNPRFAALADPTRQRIVEMLAAGALTSGEIAGRFELSPPAISQHLKALKEARLLLREARRMLRRYAHRLSVASGDVRSLRSVPARSPRLRRRAVSGLSCA